MLFLPKIQRYFLKDPEPMEGVQVHQSTIQTKEEAQEYLSGFAKYRVVSVTIKGEAITVETSGHHDFPVVEEFEISNLLKQLYVDVSNDAGESSDNKVGEDDEFRIRDFSDDEEVDIGRGLAGQ